MSDSLEHRLTSLEAGQKAIVCALAELKKSVESYHNEVHGDGKIRDRVTTLEQTEKARGRHLVGLWALFVGLFVAIVESWLARLGR